MTRVQRSTAILVATAILIATLVFLYGCTPYVTVLSHQGKPVQGEPEPRTTLLDLGKYAGAAMSREVAALVAVEKIVSGVSADWRTRAGDTLLITVPAPNGASMALRAGANGKPTTVSVQTQQEK